MGATLLAMDPATTDPFARFDDALRAAKAPEGRLEGFTPAADLWELVQTLELGLVPMRVSPPEVFRAQALGPLGIAALRLLPVISQLIDRGRAIFDLVRAVPALSDRVPPFSRLLDLLEEHEELFEQVADLRAIDSMSPEDREVATDAELA